MMFVIYIRDIKSKYKEDEPKAKHHKSDYSNGDKPRESKSWLYPQLRVRIVNKDYKEGRYYNTKVSSIDP